MKNKLLPGLFFVVAVGSIAHLLKPALPTASAETGTKISIEEVAKHDSVESCWMAIDGDVYDVTKYIPKHGNNSIIDGCGRDASQMFAGERKHAVKGRALLPEFKIGILG
jgi:cytochrome b involved in lipid metabolism